MKKSAQSRGRNSQSAIRNLEQGHDLRLAGKFTAALAAYQRYLRDAPDPLSRVDGLVGIAMCHRGMCRYRAAIRSFDQALPVYKRLADREGEAFVLYGRGGAYRFLGEFKRADRDLRVSLKLTRDPEAKAFTLMALAGLDRMRGRNRRSLSLYTRALALGKRLRHRYAQAYAHCGIGNAWRMLGDARQARRHLVLADRLYRSIGDRVSRPYTLWALALLDRDPRRLAEAERLWRATRDHRGLVYAGLGRAVLAGDRPAEALRQAKRLGIRLEEAHAAALCGLARARCAYRSLGVKPPAFPAAIP